MQKSSLAAVALETNPEMVQNVPFKEPGVFGMKVN